MSLTAGQRRIRDARVTAGFAPYLMAGKEDRILSEWMRLTGHPDYEEPKPAWNFLYGKTIEPIALDWHEEQTGYPLTRLADDDSIIHPELDYVCATLDAYREYDDCVIDCKAWSSWQKVGYICEFLCPQLIVQRACKQAQCAALLLVHGGAEPAEYPLSWGAEYEASVWERIAEFWQCVQDLRPPYAMPAIEADIIPTDEICMDFSNIWADRAAVWLKHRPAVKEYYAADEEIKVLVERKYKKAYGSGIVLTRNRRGAATIKEMTE